MTQRVLVASQHPELLRLCGQTELGFTLETVKTGQEALTALESGKEWVMLIADYNLPDMDCLQFFSEARILSHAVPILAADADEIIARIHLVSNENIYRILPLPCSSEMLFSVLQDGARQYKLITRGQELQKQLQQAALTDPLTGCYSSGYLRERLTKEIQRSVRYTHPLAVIHGDIDQLKAINNAHGHTVGDQILAAFSDAARQTLREDVDWIARWKDDFVIILPETPVKGAGLVAERLRKMIAKLQLSGTDEPVQVTASFGVTGFTPEKPDHRCTMDELLSLADNCLLQAKMAGGDSIHFCA